MSEPSVTEEALRRVRRGEIDAFEVIVKEHEWQLRAWVAARCPPDVDPDEIAHLSFIQAFTNLAQYAEGTNFRAWLWTLARHQLLTAIGRSTRRDDNEDNYLPEAMRRALQRELDDASGEDEYLLALRECVGGLAPHARALVDRHYRDGEGLAEIAAGSTRSVASVKKALFQARRALEDCVRRRVASGS